MRLSVVKVYRHEDEAVLLTQHLTGCGVYGMYRRKDKYFEIVVGEHDLDLALNLIATCPMLKELAYKKHKFGEN